MAGNITIVVRTEHTTLTDGGSMWRKLKHPKNEPEKELQALFDNWPEREGWQLAGVPEWLR